MATANVSPNTTRDQIDPHLAWAARAQQLQAERDLVRDDAACDVLMDELWTLYDLIGETRASTLAGALAQVQVVLDQLVTGVSGGAERERTALANAAATLDRLGTAAA